MVSVALVSFCCIMFIHLGLGDAISKVLRIDFVLFRCVKCLNFWMVLCYTFLFVKLSLIGSLSVAFLTSYIALWIDLLLAKIAKVYDIWYKKIEEDLE